MLTDNDFDEIGKRLYDHESDPPEKGWNRIASELHPPGDDSKAFFVRHWWKPLLLAIPVSVYLLLPPQQRMAGTSLTALTEQPVDLMSRESATETKTSEPDAIHAIENTSEIGSGNTNALIKLKARDEAATETGAGNTAPQTIARPAESLAKKSSQASAPTVDDDRLKSRNHIINGHHVLNERDSLLGNPVAQGDATLPVAVMPVYSHDGGSTPDQQSSHAIASVTGDVISGTAPTQSVHQSNEGNFDNAGAEGRQNNQAQAIGRTENQGNSSGTREIRTLAITPLADTISIVEVVPDNEALELDSASATEETENGRYSSWRVTASVVPQFTYQSVRPVGSDEVLVTSINKRNANYPERIGLGFAFGAGRLVFRNVYLDAQLAYTQTKQRIDYAYTTGKVDTLVAALQADGSVRVIPVYAQTHATTSASYSYGGLRVTGTYYFWSNPVRRFSITAGAGLNILLTGSIRENINGQRIESSQTGANKTDYSFLVGAGYSVNLGHGMELMISPVLNYYLKKISNEQQPFNFNHRSYGLNIMLSKYF